LISKQHVLQTKLCLKRISNNIKKVIDCESTIAIPNLKPIVGYLGFYRCGVGDYRIGKSVDEGIVWFHFFGKRDESTYKKFP
jgi:mRNA-degrading endonuclease RelE of RelBE toxin-antitoxin system